MNFKSLLSTAFVGLSFSAFSQSATYAITGNGSGDYQWMNIKQIDIASGTVVKELYQNNKTSFVMVDADTKVPATIQNFKVNNNGTITSVQIQDAPTISMVAAAAYDKVHNKLFFTPMQIGELRWMDFGANGTSPKFYSQKTQLLNTNNLLDEANHITRMDIAADGNGYAVTNDANHLIKFTTGNKTVITDLGNLVDDASNKGISIHNKCTSWGGDMVADAYGKLYIISASHNIFKVNIDTRMATYVGAITGLPATFTSNGAAVDDDGNIVVSSAVSFDGLYKFNINDLKAVKIESSNKNFNASDLANGNLLNQKQYDAERSFDIVNLTPAPISEARIFPNPVTGSEFKILLSDQKAGQYNLMISDISGKPIMNKSITVFTKTASQTIQIKNIISKGVYLVKLIDANNQTVFTDRVVVQ